MKFVDDDDDEDEHTNRIKLIIIIAQTRRYITKGKLAPQIHKDFRKKILNANAPLQIQTVALIAAVWRYI